MTREEFYSQDLFEEAYYDGIEEDDQEIRLPITKLGFEALLVKAASRSGLHVDDKLRAIFCGFVHHIANHIHTTTIEAIARVLHKSYANDMTWEIDQAIKKSNAAKLTVVEPSGE